MAVYCLKCNRSDVGLAYVQVGTSAPGGLITHSIDVATREAATNDGTPVAGCRSGTTEATRVALTVGCAGCGHEWSTIPQESGLRTCTTLGRRSGGRPGPDVVVTVTRCGDVPELPVCRCAGVPVCRCAGATR